MRFDGDAAEREAEAADACLVQPLQVVDEERDRVGLGELRQQSLDRQRYRQGIGLALAGFGALQGDCEGAALRTRKAAVRSLGKLADQFGEPRKRQSLVELGRSDRKHPSLADLGQLSGATRSRLLLPAPGSPIATTLPPPTRTSFTTRKESSRPNNPNAADTSSMRSSSSEGHVQSRVPLVLGRGISLMP